jgi:hypothetical protein
VSAGDFHGLRTEIVESAHLRVELALDAGPRIVRLSKPGGANVFAETPDAGWDTVHGRPFRLLGGHRLWSAPECPLEQQVPDDEPVEVHVEDGMITVHRDARHIELQLAADGPRVRVRHVLRNDTGASVRIAAWALTQLRTGGVAVLPLGGDGGPQQLPDRNLVLWPYSSLGDTRFSLSDKEVRVHAKPAPGFFKVGYLNRTGRIAYELADVTFVKRFAPEPDAEHADGGANVEVYVCDEFIELETLSPLHDLAPGASIEHVEEWELCG